MTAPAVLFGVGAATGLIGSLLGLGGGVLLVPLLTISLGVPFRTAVAVSLMSVIASASASATINLRKGLVNLRLGLVLEVATSVGGLCGAVISHALTEAQLYAAFATAMAVLGIGMAARSQSRNVIADPTVDTGRLGGILQEGITAYAYRFTRVSVALAAALLAGAVSGLLGVGGGTVKVPVLNALCGIPIRVAAATSTFMIGVTAAASAFQYYGRHEVPLALMAPVCLGTLPASLLGAHLSDGIHPRLLKVLMAIVLLSSSAQMALRAL
jgi:uncharacterized membrane protein YfcA